MFIIEDRKIKNKDAVTLKTGFVKGKEYGEIVLDQTLFNFIMKLPSLLYVYNINKDGTMLQVRNGKKGQKYDQMLPVFFFKVVKVPKTNDVVNWLYDNQLITFPEHWRPFKTEITSLSRYVPKIFQTNLKAIYMVNKNCNHLYFSNDPFEVIMFYKTIVQQLGLQFYDRYNIYPEFSIRQSFIKEVLLIDPGWHTKDAIAIYEMNNHNVFHDTKYVSNKDRLGLHKDPKKYKEELINNHREVLESFEERDLKIVDVNDTRFLPELTQEVIDEFELVIFNVKSLPNRNQILFIFIDKDDNKRFYVEDFKFTFFVSNVSSIIHNDYIEQFDLNKHVPFMVKSFEILRNLKFAINESHKKFMKKGKF